MILGFSDATIAVVKRGMECRDQGLLADHIGMQVCPRVLRFLDDGYEMEVLSPPHSRGWLELVNVFGMLTLHVWPRRAFRNQLGGWRRDLLKWSLTATWITDAIEQLYPVEPDDGYSLIHGDPAMANLMFRGSERVITDPMPRLPYRWEIPNRKEVDMGKLIQSAIGWERMLGCESSMWEQHLDVLAMIPVDLQAKALLWGAIHLARVARRAPIKGKHKIGCWAQDASRRLIKELGCSTS